MEDQNPQIRSATQARQGVTGHKVRYVLLWSTLLAAIAMMGLLWGAVHFGTP